MDVVEETKKSRGFRVMLFIEPLKNIYALDGAADFFKFNFIE